MTGLHNLPKRARLALAFGVAIDPGMLTIPVICVSAVPG